MRQSRGGPTAWAERVAAAEAVLRSYRLTAALLRPQCELQACAIHQRAAQVLVAEEAALTALEAATARRYDAKEHAMRCACWLDMLGVQFRERQQRARLQRVAADDAELRLCLRAMMAGDEARARDLQVHGAYRLLGSEADQEAAVRSAWTWGKHPPGGQRPGAATAEAWTLGSTGERGEPPHVLLAAPVAAWAVEESLLHLLGTAADAADVAEDNGGALHACAAAGRNGRSGGGAPRAEEIGHRRPGIRWESGRARAVQRARAASRAVRQAAGTRGGAGGQALLAKRSCGRARRLTAGGALLAGPRAASSLLSMCQLARRWGGPCARAAAVRGAHLARSEGQQRLGSLRAGTVRC
jgi:hypothetical protein